MKILKLAGPAAIALGALLMLFSNRPTIGGLILMIGSLLVIAISMSRNRT